MTNQEEIAVTDNINSVFACLQIISTHFFLVIVYSFSLIVVWHPVGASQLSMIYINSMAFFYRNTYLLWFEKLMQGIFRILFSIFQRSSLPFLPRRPPPWGETRVIWQDHTCVLRHRALAIVSSNTEIRVHLILLLKFLNHKNLLEDYCLGLWYSKAIVSLGLGCSNSLSLRFYQLPLLL